MEFAEHENRDGDRQRPSNCNVLERVVTSGFQVGTPSRSDIATSFGAFTEASVHSLREVLFTNVRRHHQPDEEHSGLHRVSSPESALMQLLPYRLP